MGRKKAKWRNADVEDITDAIAKQTDIDNKNDPEGMDDESLFFEDKAGNVEGQASRKRKAKAAKQTENKRKKHDKAAPAPKKPKRKTTTTSTANKQVQALTAPQQELIAQETAQDVMDEIDQAMADIAQADVLDTRKTRRKAKAINERKDFKDMKKAIQTAMKKKKSNAPEVLRDLWAEESVDTKVQKMREGHKGFEINIIPKVSATLLCQRNRKVRDVKASKTLVSAQGTQVAGSGQSFNPDEGERQLALQKAYDLDVKLTTEATELNKKLYREPKFCDSVPEEDDESELLPLRKRKGQLSTAQRNKKQKRWAADQAKALELKQKEMFKQIDRLGAVMGSIKKEEKTLKKKHERIAELKETHPDHRPKTSKHEFEPVFPEIPLEDELDEDRSLRAVKPSLHVVRDQFKSFQEKNLIETRKRVKGLKRRYKLKEYTRNSHKEPNQKFHAKGNKA